MSGKAIKNFMTAMPHTIGPNQSLATAKAMMHDFNIRHLPVLSQNQLVGVITDRDVRFAESIKGYDVTKLLVDDVYSPDPFETHPDHDVLEICEKMASDKIGCTVVVEHQKVVGIFTWIDALKNIKKLN